MKRAPQGGRPRGGMPSTAARGDVHPPQIERESAFLLLVLQVGIGLVTAADPIALSLGGSPGNALLGVLTVLLAVAELALAVLFLRGSRRATSWLAGYQALCLSGAVLALSIHLGADSRLAPLVTNLVIPTLLLLLLLRSRERGLRVAGADEVDRPVEQPAHATAQTAERAPVQVQL
jgi:hypothetical protein